MPVFSQTNRFNPPHASSASASALGRRPGFTFLEVLTVFVIFGIVTAIAVPRLRGYKQQADLRSAKQHLSSYVTTARAAAIRRGRAATFTVAANNKISVSVDSSGVQVPIATPFSMTDAYAVKLPTGLATVTFDRRGFAMGLAATKILVVANATRRDSVCVTRLGVILTDGCTP